MKLLILCFLVIIARTSAFYYRIDVDSDGGVNTKSLVTSSSLTVTKDGTDDYPLEFSKRFVSDGETYSYLFKKSVRYTKPSDKSDQVYTIDESGKLKLVNFNTSENVQSAFYRSDDNTAIATLILNTDLKKSGFDIQEKYRTVVTVLNKNAELILYPALIVPKQQINTRVLVKPRLVQIVEKLDSNKKFGTDYKVPDVQPEQEQPKYAEDKRKKRAVSGQPVTLFVETLVVADYSILLKQRNVLSITTNDNIVFQYMKIYYSHFLAAVDQRYINSFVTDPDLKIRVTVANFLFLSTEAASNWTNPTYVGDSANPTYNGRPVVVASPTLNAFTNWMNGQSFPFSYDHAVAFFDKDIFSDSTTDTAATRAGVVGFAWVAAVCGQYRYSIQEDKGFNSISVVSHELGHNLGSKHDGDSVAAPTCPVSDNYIMTPVTGFYSGNYANYYKFSSCSITQFKATLLSSNGPASTLAQCLTNVPVTFPLESTYFNTTMNGQMWSADDQCKMIIAPNSSYCAIGSLSDICFQLWCYTLNQSSCTSSKGWGALDGTPCGAGMVCKESVCISDAATTFAANPCAVNPCINGGTCQKTQSFYMCICPAGFTGVNCELSAPTTIAGATTAPPPTTLAGGTTVPPPTTLAGGTTAPPPTTLAGATTPPPPPPTTVAGGTNTPPPPTTLPANSTQPQALAARSFATKREPEICFKIILTVLYAIILNF